MRTRFDQLAKNVLETALSPLGEVRTQEEIHGEVQAADVLFRPVAQPAIEPGRVGLLGRMARTSCLIEPFHTTARADAVLDCIDKHLTLRRKRVRAARKAGNEPDIPRLWVLSAGRPRSVVTGLRFAKLRGWPTGVWEGPPLLCLYLVVLSDLPETRDTLPLRLLAAGKTFWRAANEVRAMPRDQWESLAFGGKLIAYSQDILQNPEEASEEDMRNAVDYQKMYDEWERDVLAKGREQGREQGIEQGTRQAIVDTYEARFGAVPAALQAAIDAMTDIATLRRWTTLVATATPDEIAAALQPRRARRVARPAKSRPRAKKSSR